MRKLALLASALLLPHLAAAQIYDTYHDVSGSYVRLPDNSLGFTAYTKIVGPPGTITGLVMPDIESTSALFQWTAPTSGGAPIGFIFQYRVQGTTPFTSVAVTSAATSYKLTGLTASTIYDFQVLATNSFGQSATPSNLFSSMTLTAITAGTPFAVAAFSAGTPTSTTIPLNITAASSGPTPTGYQSQSRPTSTTQGGWSNNVASGSLPITMTGFTSGSTVDVRVIPIGSAGNGPPSDFVTVTLP